MGVGERSVTDDLDERPDATVIDLGGFSTPAESRAAALAVLDHLWENRAQRVGRLIVIDEAHNLCTPDPATPVEKLLTERIVQIAAEGRKYGLWLLLSTQRPSKLHPNALSQCDNLALMRMSSPRDLAELAGVFGYAPESLLERSTGFTQGQALFAAASSTSRASCRWVLGSPAKAAATWRASALSVAASRSGVGGDRRFSERTASRRAHDQSARPGRALGGKPCTRRERLGGGPPRARTQGWDLGRVTRPGAVSEVRAGTGQGAGCEVRGAGMRSRGAAASVGVASGAGGVAGARRGSADGHLRHHAGRQLERDLALEHLDRLVGERDEPVELFAHAAVGDLSLGRASRPGRSRS